MKLKQLVNLMKHLFLTGLFLFSIVSFSQESTSFNDAGPNKGKFFAYWGWNRGHYSDSDITFKGDDYNFTLSNVESKDKPKPFGIYYFKIDEITIPQTNFRIGYFFKENYTVSIGVDHMKYVMKNDQSVKFKGDLPSGSDAFVSGNEIVLSEDFLLFEHTDCLNYINAEINRVDDLSNLLGLPNTDKFQINVTEGLGAGLLYPKTNTTLLGKDRYDEFHIAGYGVSAKAGLTFTFYKHFFIPPILNIT